MVTCPRCQQPVDETVRSTCPLCFSPIPQAVQQAAQPAAPLAAPGPEPSSPSAGQSYYGQPPQPVAPGAHQQPPAYGAYPYPGQQQTPVPMPAAHRPPLNPGARVSLTGEVIDPGAPVGPAPGYVGGSPVAPSRVGQPPAASRTQVPQRRESAPAAERPGSGNAVGIVLALLVLIGGGVGGWYYWMHRTNPKDQALAVYKSYLSQDYKAAYSLSALGPTGKKNFPDADSFATAQQTAINTFLTKLPFGSSLLDSLKAAATTAAVGEPVVTADKAEVPTSCTLTFMGRSVKMKGTAHMVNDGGIWKMDLTADNTQEATNAGRDLVGKPEL